MKGRYLKGLFVIVAIGALLLSLVLWWPLRMWVPLFNQQLPAGWRIEGMTGSLWSGEMERLMILGTRIGPWQWQLDPWHQRLNWRLGTSQQSPWVGHIDWQGADQWRLRFSGGDLRWIDTRLWGMQLAGVAQGELDVTGYGMQCRKVTQGKAYWAPLRIVWPPQSKRSFQQVETTVGCLANGRWSLDAWVKEAGVLDLSVDGQQVGVRAWQWSLKGWISPEYGSHPVIGPLRRWLSPDPQGQFQKSLRSF